MHTLTPYPSPRAYIVGLTGGIGSGKSAAAERFATHGARIVDTDVIAHQLTAPHGQALPALQKTFGAAVIADDGALDRAVMRERVFADPSARARLEGILHPLIRAESTRLCAQAQSDYVMLVVPLLVESAHWRKYCDRVCVVDCSEALQIARVQSRSGLEPEQIRAIMAAQAGREARLAAADDVLDNNGSRAALEAQVDLLHARYLELARIHRLATD